MTTPWLTVIGIGLDGWNGLSARAKTLIAAAEALFGSERQLALVPPAAFTGQRIVWKGLDDTAASILAYRGRPVAALSSGDPMFYGLGATMVRGRIDPAEMLVLPHPGSYSLACAALGWPMQDVLFLTAHGRPLDNVFLHLRPNIKWLVLCADGTTPALLAQGLVERGYGDSRLIALADLGGDARRWAATARSWTVERTGDLVVLAVDLIADPDAVMISGVPGLPDDAYEHDGQLTKREVRALTLAALRPRPRAVLWDVGAGSGSIGIEWLRAGGTKAVAFEKSPERLAFIACNAARLGATALEIVDGEAPACLGKRTDVPDAIFLGGQVARDGLLDACWDRLAGGGTLVANAVTPAAQDRLAAWQAAHGGELTRIAVARFVDGEWEDKAPIVQYRGIKP